MLKIYAIYISSVIVSIAKSMVHSFKQLPFIWTWRLLSDGYSILLLLNTN